VTRKGLRIRAREVRGNDCTEEATIGARLQCPAKSSEGMWRSSAARIIPRQARTKPRAESWDIVFGASM